ncbi:protein of unknown function [Modestobacter italicus]|uniref:Uncharacterized protein n=1 Tax=Modestobacter italicus (strain DSM 44449 / CECT 9708 / BC 501) TaxID=2732864 RepID=I4F0K7_MODI5|nr:protein of unknown function [Modestobacter marinus]
MLRSAAGWGASRVSAAEGGRGAVCQEVKASSSTGVSVGSLTGVNPPPFVGLVMRRMAWLRDHLCTGAGEQPWDQGWLGTGTAGQVGVRTLA